MKHRDRVPGPPPRGGRVAGRHDSAAALQRDVRRRSADRRGDGDRLPAGQARDSGARRLDGRDARHRGARGPAAGGARLRHQVSASRGPHGLQGGRARRGPQGRARRVHRDLRRGLRAAAGFPAPHRRLLRGPEARAGPGALGPSQPGLLAAHARAGGAARRPLRARARRAQPLGLLLQFQRHGGRVAPHGDRRRRRLAARHADRRSRSQLSRADARLAVPVPAGSASRRRSCPSR